VLSPALNSQVRKASHNLHTKPSYFCNIQSVIQSQPYKKIAVLDVFSSSEIHVAVTGYQLLQKAYFDFHIH